MGVLLDPVFQNKAKIRNGKKYVKNISYVSLYFFYKINLDAIDFKSLFRPLMSNKPILSFLLGKKCEGTVVQFCTFARLLQ